jgi:hypothetical protein
VTAPPPAEAAPRPKRRLAQGFNGGGFRRLLGLGCLGSTVVDLAFALGFARLGARSEIVARAAFSIYGGVAMPAESRAPFGL